MHCPNCGIELQHGMDVCTSCGTPISVNTNVPQQAATDPGENKGLISMICGIVALVLTALPGGGGFFGPVGAIVGLVLGKTAQKESEAAGFVNKKAKTGIICSIISLALWVLSVVAVVVILVIYVLIYVFLFGFVVMGSM